MNIYIEIFIFRTKYPPLKATTYKFMQPVLRIVINTQETCICFGTETASYFPLCKNGLNKFLFIFM